MDGYKSLQRSMKSRMLQICLTGMGRWFQHACMCPYALYLQDKHCNYLLLKQFGIVIITSRTLHTIYRVATLEQSSCQLCGQGIKRSPRFQGLTSPQEERWLDPWGDRSRMVEDKRQPPAKDAATSDETERDGQKADGLGDLQFLLTETLFRTAWSILCEELCSTDLEVWVPLSRFFPGVLNPHPPRSCSLKVPSAGYIHWAIPRYLGETSVIWRSSTGNLMINMYILGDFPFR